MRATLRSLRHGGPAAVGAVLLVALAVLAAGATLAAGTAIARQRALWWAELRLVAVLRDSAPRPAGGPAVADAARAVAGVAAVRLVPADQALAELRRLLGARGEDLDRLPVNPVPARLEVTPAADLDAAGLRALLEGLARLPPVDEVQAAIDWVEPVERLARGLRLGGLAAATLLALGALLALAAATTAVRRARGEETAVLRLAGVPEGRLWGPQLLQAILLGSLGAAIGVGALLLVSEPGTAWTARWLRAALGLAPLPALPGGWLAVLGGTAPVLGLTAGLLAGRP